MANLGLGEFENTSQIEDAINTKQLEDAKKQLRELESPKDENHGFM